MQTIHSLHIYFLPTVCKNADNILILHERSSNYALYNSTKFVNIENENTFTYVFS